MINELLADELLTRVFCFVKAGDFSSISKVCRHWRSLAYDREVLSSLFGKHFEWIAENQLSAAVKALLIFKKWHSGLRYRTFFCGKKLEKEARILGQFKNFICLTDDKRAPFAVFDLFELGREVCFFRGNAQEGERFCSIVGERIYDVRMNKRAPEESFLYIANLAKREESSIDLKKILASERLPQEKITRLIVEGDLLLAIYERRVLVFDLGIQGEPCLDLKRLQKALDEENRVSSDSTQVFMPI